MTTLSVTDAKPQKIDAKTLLTAIEVAMDNWLVADGTEQLLADTGKTRQQLLDAIMADDEVESCREDLRTAILASPWRIWGDGVDEELINRLYCMMRYLLDDFAELAILAKFNGYAVAEYVFERQADGFLSLKQVLSKDGELDRYQPQRNGTVLMDIDAETVVIDTRVKHLVLTCKAVPARPAGELMVIRAYPAVALRRRGFAYAGQFIARYAQPYVVGKQAQNFGDARTFTSTLYGFLNGGAAGIGSDDDIDIHQLSGEGVAFEALERLCNRRIQKLLLGRVKTSELSSGSRAAQETDEKVRQDRNRAYLDLMARACQHAIDAVLAVNARFGVPVNAPKGIWFEYEQQFGVDKTRAERDRLYCDTGQVRLTKAYLIDIVGYEEAHIEMVEQPQSGRQLSKDVPSQDVSSQNMLSLANQQFVLSQTPMENPGPTTTEAKVSKAKMTAILSMLNQIDDDDEQGYAKFSQRLDDLTLPDAGFIQDLAEQTTDAFVKGLDGHVNAHGENQL